MSLSAIVSLYRMCGRPELEGGSFSVSGPANEELLLAVRTVYQTSPGSFRELLVDDDEVLRSDQLDLSGTVVEFTFQLPASSDVRFYKDTKDLVDNSGAVCKGLLPEEFYIVDIDYLHGEQNPPKQLETLISICEAIQLLSSIAHYHDQKTVSDNRKLVFINPEGKSDKPAIVLETNIDFELLSVGPIDCSILRDITDNDSKRDPHYVAKKGVFWSSLAEFSKQTPKSDDAFTNLIKNWNEFLALFQNNLETYLSGFAFHKAKREVAEAELDLASQFSKIIGDITGKLLAIPVSLAALVAIGRADNVFEQIIICVGLLVSSLLIVGVVDNQQRQLGRISHAKSVVMNSFMGKKTSYPEDLKTAIDSMNSNLASNESNLKWTLRFFRAMAWLPVISATYIVFELNC